MPYCTGMNKNQPNWAEIIQNRRNELDLTQEALANEADVSPSTIVKLERGAQNFLTMKVENFYGLLRALKWTVADVEKFAGVTLEDKGGTVDPATQPAYKMLPVRALASAGKPLDTTDPAMEYHPVPLNEYQRGLELYCVTGDSMTTSNPNSIFDGDILAVNSHDLALRDNKIYVVQIAGEGITVKRARKHRGTFWLFSDNPDHAPFKPDEATVLGRVMWWYHMVRDR